jgi:hypothetical protein
MSHIGSSIQELEPEAGAPLSAAILARLQDLDANRIAANDGVVIRKAVLALLGVVAELESRITALETGAERRM